MPIEGENRTIKKDGAAKDIYTVTFSNGALKQLEDLQKFFKQKEIFDVVKFGIGVLQELKDPKEKIR